MTLALSACGGRAGTRAAGAWGGRAARARASAGSFSLLIRRTSGALSSRSPPSIGASLSRRQTQTAIFCHLQLGSVASALRRDRARVRGHCPSSASCSGLGALRGLVQSRLRVTVVGSRFGLSLRCVVQARYGAAITRRMIRCSTLPLDVVARARVWALLGVLARFCRYGGDVFAFDEAPAAACECYAITGMACVSECVSCPHAIEYCGSTVTPRLMHARPTRPRRTKEKRCPQGRAGQRSGAG